MSSLRGLLIFTVLLICTAMLHQDRPIVRLDGIVKPAISDSITYIWNDDYTPYTDSRMRKIVYFPPIDYFDELENIGRLAVPSLFQVTPIDVYFRNEMLIPCVYHKYGESNNLRIINLGSEMKF